MNKVDVCKYSGDLANVRICYAFPAYMVWKIPLAMQQIFRRHPELP